MRIVGVIPVRLASSRFPGKALVKLNGKEIVLHVFERARRYVRFEKVIVATDDMTIRHFVESKGGEVFFSTQPYRNGSERCAAAIAGIACDICVNIQGDEVFITPQIIAQAVGVLERDSSLPVATAVFPIMGDLTITDRNLVKVVLDERGDAINFSRLPITNSNGSQPPNYGHVGIYAYRKEFLLRYAALPPSAGEVAESLEQLRILDSGYRIGAVQLDKPVISINTPNDLELAARLLSTEGGVKQ